MKTYILNPAISFKTDTGNAGVYAILHHINMARVKKAIMRRYGEDGLRRIFH